MNGQPLATTEEESDIGVRVAASLKPTAQCRKAAKTAQTVLSQLTRAFHYRDRHVFVKLYKTYVRPHLEFASPAWSPWSVADKTCLEAVQRRAVAMVSGLNGTTYEEKLNELGLTTLEERRHQQDMVQAHKILTGQDRTDVNGLFSMAADGARATRAAAEPLTMRIPVNRLEVRKHFFSQRVPSDWNKIPAEIRGVQNRHAFKRAYGEHRRVAAAT